MIVAKKASATKKTAKTTAKKTAKKAAKKAPKRVAKKPPKKAAKKVVKAAKKSAKKVAKVTKKAAKKTPKKVAKAAKKAAKKSAKKTTGTVAGKTIKKVAKKAKAAPKRRRANSRLSKKEMDHFHQLLPEKRQTLTGDMTGMHAEALRNSHEASGDLSTMPVHMADVGTDNYEQEFTLGLLESERLLLRKIDDALDRMARGAYGICLGTGESICKPRLRAKPWAKYTIAYARLIEQGQVEAPTSELNHTDQRKKKPDNANWTESFDFFADDD